MDQPLRSKDFTSKDFTSTDPDQLATANLPSFQLPAFEIVLSPDRGQAIVSIGDSDYFTVAEMRLERGDCWLQNNMTNDPSQRDWRTIHWRNYVLIRPGREGDFMTLEANASSQASDKTSDKIQVYLNRPTSSGITLHDGQGIVLCNNEAKVYLGKGENTTPVAEIIFG